MFLAIKDFWFIGHFNVLVYALLANVILSWIGAIKEKGFVWSRFNDYLARLSQYTAGLLLMWLFTKIDASFVGFYATAYAAISFLLFKNVLDNLKRAFGLDLTFILKWVPERKEQ